MVQEIPESIKTKTYPDIVTLSYKRQSMAALANEICNFGETCYIKSSWSSTSSSSSSS